MPRASILALLLALAAPLPAAALTCEQMWFARNALFNQAGYCFGSVLGQALFNNADCTTRAPQLSARQSAQVAALKEMEAEAGCAIYTGVSFLDLPHLAQWQRLSTLPWPEMGGSACIGWRGAPLTLHAAPAANAPVLSVVRPGQTLTFTALPEGVWDFVQTEDGVGWSNGARFSEALCDQLAG